MTAIVIVMSVLACGAWLRYAVVPVLAAYELGKRVEAARRRTRRTGPVSAGWLIVISAPGAVWGLWWIFIGSKRRARRGRDER